MDALMGQQPESDTPRQRSTEADVLPVSSHSGLCFAYGYAVFRSKMGHTGERASCAYEYGKGSMQCPTAARG